MSSCFFFSILFLIFFMRTRKKNPKLIFTWVANKLLSDTFYSDRKQMAIDPSAVDALLHLHAPAAFTCCVSTERSLPMIPCFNSPVSTCGFYSAPRHPTSGECCLRKRRWDFLLLVTCIFFFTLHANIVCLRTKWNSPGVKAPCLSITGNVVSQLI